MDEKVKILLFGILAEKAAASELVFPLVKDSDTLMQQIEKVYPAFSADKFSMAINKNLISENTALQPGDEIALLPPFSGG